MDCPSLGVGFRGKKVPNLIPNMIQTSSEYDPKMIPKWSQNDTSVIPQWSQTDSKWSQRDLSMIPTSCDNHAKTIPTWFANDPKAMPKSYEKIPSSLDHTCKYMYIHVDIHAYTCINIILGPFWDHCFCTIWAPWRSFELTIWRVDTENWNLTFWKGPRTSRARQKQQQIRHAKQTRRTQKQLSSEFCDVQKSKMASRASQEVKTG